MNLGGCYSLALHIGQEPNVHVCIDPTRTAPHKHRSMDTRPSRPLSQRGCIALLASCPAHAHTRMHTHVQGLHTVAAMHGMRTSHAHDALQRTAAAPRPHRWRRRHCCTRPGRRTALHSAPRSVESRPCHSVSRSSMRFMCAKSSRPEASMPPLIRCPLAPCLQQPEHSGSRGVSVNAC